MFLCQTDPPGPPGRPEITDYDKNHVDLKWEPPKNDGGAPVTKYIIEKKPKGGNWEKVWKLKMITRCPYQWMHILYVQL